MFFTRKPAKPAARPAPKGAAAPPPTPSNDDASVVLDALGGVLQALARYPIETESLDAESAKARLTDWMRHATLGAKHPKSAGDPAGGLASRDWRGLVAFIGEHRRSEHQQTLKGMKDLRETIWSLVSSAHRVAQADASRPVTEQLERVRAAVDSNDTEAVRREALLAVQAVTSLLDRQREDQRREFVALADRVRALGTQLEEARREITASLTSRSRHPKPSSSNDSALNFFAACSASTPHNRKSALPSFAPS
jgi:hypothetical protein